MLSLSAPEASSNNTSFAFLPALGSFDFLIVARIGSSASKNCAACASYRLSASSNWKVKRPSDKKSKASLFAAAWGWAPYPWPPKHAIDAPDKALPETAPARPMAKLPLKLDELIDAGVRVFEYTPTLLHGKALLVDDQTSVIGSANFDNRSFELNYEVVVAGEDTLLGTPRAARASGPYTRAKLCHRRSSRVRKMARATSTRVTATAAPGRCHRVVPSAWASATVSYVSEVSSGCPYRLSRATRRTSAAGTICSAFRSAS